MLSARGLSAGYGPIEVVHAADMDIAAGECVALIGCARSAGVATTVTARKRASNSENENGLVT